MNRGDFQKLTRERLIDAEGLLEKQRYSGAYYLCGYVIECALKACIAKQTKEFDFPPEPNTVRDIYVHDLKKLVNSAGIKPKLDRERERNKMFELNWAVVKDWKESSRYEERTKTQAEDLYNGIANKKYGVLQWIKQRW